MADSTPSKNRPPELPTQAVLVQELRAADALARQQKRGSPGKNWTLAGFFRKQQQDRQADSPAPAPLTDTPEAQAALVATTPVAGEEVAEFPLPEKRTTRPSKAVLALEEVLRQVAPPGTAALVTASPGKGGNWKPGPGRPRKDPLADTDSPGTRLSGRGQRAHKSGRRTDFTVAQKNHYCQKLAGDFKVTGSRKRAVFDRWAKELSCHPGTVRRMWDLREVWQQKVALAEQSGEISTGVFTCGKVGRPAKLSGQRQGKGKRQAGKRGYLGPWDPLREERLAVSAWAHGEEQNGHRLGRMDLFTVFHKMVQFKHDCLVELQAACEADQEELPEEDARCLEFCQKRLAAWQKPRRRDRAALKLLKQTGFRERKTNRQTKLIEKEEAARLLRAWRFFDWLNYLVAYGTPDQLGDHVARPEEFMLHRKETVLLFTDQVPVWLKVEAGSLLLSERRASDCRAGKRQRQARRVAAKAKAKVLGRPLSGNRRAVKPAEDLEEEEPSGSAATSYLQSGPGTTEASRWRATLICRQTVRHFWDAEAEPVGYQWQSVSE